MGQDGLTYWLNKAIICVMWSVMWGPSLSEGHGRLLEPPSRASMWRLGYQTPQNYDDNQLFCGGVGVQYGVNKGKCGICGDPWDGPRDHEAGGKYATGTIVRSYKVGQVIDVSVELTANHKGYFEFRLCPTDNPFQKITHSCLSKYPLIVQTTGETRYHVKGGDSDYSSSQKVHLKLQLPSNVKCKACLIQWKYNAGNSWGVDRDGNSCIGCGDQEQFYACSDVAIGHDDVVVGQPAVRHPWLFEGEAEKEWHYGVVKYSNDTTKANLPVSSSYKPYCCHLCMLFIALNFMLIHVLASLSS